MLVKGHKPLPICIAFLIFLSSATLIFYCRNSLDSPFLKRIWSTTGHGYSAKAHFDQHVASFELANSELGSARHDISETHVEVFSVSAKDKKYFLIEFGGEEAINPSVIPHPTLQDTWTIVAQQRRSLIASSVWYAELVCDAKFVKGKLACIKPPKILPIAVTSGDKCVDDLSVLVDWTSETIAGNEYRVATELQRPPPIGAVEKNWFVFWDKEGDPYIHYDIAPRRVFAKLGYGGSVGQDLTPWAAASDEKCMQNYMPKVADQLESIHQATNSLSITLCKRSDLGCEPNDSNTYLMTIFQHKSFYSFHSVYEPYVMLFKRASPFEIHAISSKPIWIHGRAKAGETQRPDGPEFEVLGTWNQSEMVYVTSISWKAHGQKYHGYIDDVVFINFGIEDAKTAGIDVLAGDLVTAIGLCFNS
ncbi:hypothetical protein EDD37DRAFT_682852 [Exophiala viscosa]|uniref:Uncharacterized protein n=1 Tax=Exophiala viscosa TaxID=2486360 RepID=A0AAN6DUE1_9EURO|nr:hypothetical protein EDD36DRAFT_488735 [Exophiala viscosa]KAI1623324.1 hypothetical protein EDD37DRAFT_682852 [Exophiala viscosa]